MQLPSEYSEGDAGDREREQRQQRRRSALQAIDPRGRREIVGVRPPRVKRKSLDGGTTMRHLIPGLMVLLWSSAVLGHGIGVFADSAGTARGLPLCLMTCGAQQPVT